MANIYYVGFRVEDPNEASVLSDQYTWTIYEVLREAGPKGLTALEVHKKVEETLHTSVSKSKIYAILRRLYEQKHIHRYYDSSVQSHRNAIGIVWAPVQIDADFYDIVAEKEANYIKKNLYPIFLSYWKKVMKDLTEDTEGEKWLPETGYKSYCKNCLRSHEAEEFFSSMLMVAMTEFFESDEFYDFLKENEFMVEDYEELKTKMKSKDLEREWGIKS